MPSQTREPCGSRFRSDIGLVARWTPHDESSLDRLESFVRVSSGCTRAPDSGFPLNRTSARMRASACSRYPSRGSDSAFVFAPGLVIDSAVQDGITNPLHLLDVIRCGPSERTGWPRLIAEVSATCSRRFWQSMEPTSAPLDLASLEPTGVIGAPCGYLEQRRQLAQRVSAARITSPRGARTDGLVF